MKIQDNAQWNHLKEHLQNDLKNISLSDLNKSDSRFETFSFSFDQLLVDFSKQKINEKTLQLLNSLARETELPQRIKSLFSGDKVNNTEDRAALHTALRNPENVSFEVSGKDINREVQRELTRMDELVQELTQGHWRGYSGKPIKDVVNLGVGGSDLGPLLVCEALDEFKDAHFNSINVHFASTMDGSQVSNLFEKLNPETTIFVIVSKSFTTIDTLSNANSAKAWLLSHCDDESIVCRHHFIGISANPSKMSAWGIDKERQLKLWDWVGGRFSLWSSVGLTIALKLGMENFRELLAGAHALDENFRQTDLTENIPVLFGLIGIWNTNFLKINAQAILPYDARLKYFPSYLTQLEMESNGKSVTLNGERTQVDTCPVLWGEVGPNAQHAFYQLLHQGTRKVVCDFIAPIKRFSKPDSEHEKALHEQHLLTLANCFAQSRALMVGSEQFDEELGELSGHRYYPGGQPSTSILLKELTPYSLGQLIALYEHKVFVMASLWDINPFDQWGVELGKVMAKETLSCLSSGAYVEQFDSSTNSLMNIVIAADSSKVESK